ncbi:MAG: hypothetical protein KGL64_02695 [Acidobacteriota bacterium]|nr:hypothetical protein [Acidobacteriota bacterium]
MFGSTVPGEFHHLCRDLAGAAACRIRNVLPIGRMSNAFGSPMRRIVDEIQRGVEWKS